MTINVVSLFSGAGGLDLGFHLADTNILAAIDNNQAAIDTLRLNFPDMVAEVGDLSGKTNLKLSKKLAINPQPIDILIGGPPCQGFSHARGKRDPDYKSNQLVGSFLNYVFLYDPSVVVMENVLGILSMKDMEAFDDRELFPWTVKAYEKMGYRVEWRVIHMAQYGVPQARERVILVAVKPEITGSLFPEPEYYVPYEYKGRLSVSETDKAVKNKGKGGLAATLGVKPMKGFTALREAFQGLGETRPEEPTVSTHYIFDSEYTKFISANGIQPLTTLHIAKRVTKKFDKIIAARIPEGKIYRSNRFGDRYVGVWDIINFTEEQDRLMRYVAKNQTKKSVAIGGGSDGFVPAKKALFETGADTTDANELIEYGWLKAEEFEHDGLAFKLTTKAGLQPRFRRLDRKSISPTILTVDFNGREKLHPQFLRGISLREGARIQSFPDWYQFSGNFDQIATQIGNAVPPLFSFKLATHLTNLLDS